MHRANSGLTRREALHAGAAGALSALALPTLVACSKEPLARVIVYCSVDSDVARPIFETFTKLSGVPVDPVFDTEATKTTGLVNRLLGEKARPACDVWWSSEPFGSVRLAKAGVLDRFECGHEKDFPRGWPKSLRASDGSWYAHARRQRVVVYNTKAVPTGELPKRLGELAKERWNARVAMARPQFGTTRGHMAALLLACGEDAFTAWLAGLKRNRVRLYDGNASVVRAVAQGEAFLGLTDNDDVASGKANAWGVEMHPIGSHLLDTTHDRAALGSEPFPERAMQVPCTVALIKGAPNRAGGARLASYLLSAAVDDTLTASVFQTHPTREPPREPTGLRRRDALGRDWLQLSNLDLEKVAEFDARAMELCEKFLGA
jgi:iron(III) transport system substrate-binding protein